MALLDRYRKSGGFIQLLTLLETCGLAKQERFLEIIRNEDARWADAIRSRMLDMDKIYGWNQETLTEVIGTLQDLTIAVALHAASQETRAKIEATFSHSRKRKIDDIFETTSPSPLEISATHMKIIETVRKMAHEGLLRFEKIDPSLMIEEEIEDKLSKMPEPASASDQKSKSTVTDSATAMATTMTTTAVTATEASGDETPNVLEIQSLKKRIAEVSKENATLRHELSVAKAKLDQIKKIA